MSQTPHDNSDNFPPPLPQEQPPQSASTTASRIVPGVMLPPPLPGGVAGVGEDRLRWLCLRLAEKLQAGALAQVWDIEVDAFSDLAAELAELVLSGLTPGRQPRAALAWARLTGRHGPLALDESQRQAWLIGWNEQLLRAGLPPHLSQPLNRWMAQLTRQWVAPQEGASIVPLHRPR
ncbi:MAG TPA: hypothetical protein VJ548_03785 [Azospira sp.]|nr:hypothetical protein [Azospira sp.]